MEMCNKPTTYPRPQFVRKKTRLLNGEWQCEIKGEQSVKLVPSLPIKGSTQIVYAKSFEVWEKELKESIILNFGGVYGDAEILVNNNLIASHSGGCGFFNMDITPYLVEGENHLVVAILGANEERIGIWQPVWLEFCGKNYIVSLMSIPVASQNSLIIKGRLKGEGGFLTVDIFCEKEKVCSYRYEAKNPFILSVPLGIPVSLWQPLNAKIYDIRLGYQDENGRVYDTVGSYTAFRKVSLEDGLLYVNDKAVFIKAIALNPFEKDSPTIFKQTLTELISMGFNCAIQKEAPLAPILKYYADRLGFLLIETNPQNSASDWEYIVNNSFGNPSVVLWQPITSLSENGELCNRLYNWTKGVDASRPILSGAERIYQCDMAYFRLKDNTVDELIAFLYEGKDIKLKAKEEKKLRKENPFLRTDKEVQRLGKLIEFSLGEITKTQQKEQELIELITRLTEILFSQKSAGYIFDAFNDTADVGSGLCDQNGDMKISKSAKNKIFLANCQKSFNPPLPPLVQ